MIDSIRSVCNAGRNLNHKFVLLLSFLFISLSTLTCSQELDELNFEDELGDIELDLDILGMDLGTDLSLGNLDSEYGMDAVDVVDLVRSILKNDGKYYELSDMYSLQTGDVRSLVVNNKFISFKSITLEDEFDLGLDMEQTIKENIVSPQHIEVIDSTEYLVIKDMITFQGCIFEGDFKPFEHIFFKGGLVVNESSSTKSGVFTFQDIYADKLTINLVPTEDG